MEMVQIMLFSAHKNSKCLFTVHISITAIDEDMQQAIDSALQEYKIKMKIKWQSFNAFRSMNSDSEKEQCHTHAWENL